MCNSLRTRSLVENKLDGPAKSAIKQSRANERVNYLMNTFLGTGPQRSPRFFFRSRLLAPGSECASRFVSVDACCYYKVARRQGIPQSKPPALESHCRRRDRSGRCVVPEARRSRRVGSRELLAPLALLRVPLSGIRSQIRVSSGKNPVEPSMPLRRTNIDS